MKFVNVKVGGTAISLMQRIHENVAAYEQGRPIDVIHASAVTKDGEEFCPRAYILMDITNTKPKGQFIGTSMRVTFDHGDMMQKRLNEVYLKDYAVGDWECVSCGKKKKFCKHPTEKDDAFEGIKCVWEYKEVRVISPKCGISGGIDTIIDAGATKMDIVEDKTMVKEEFEKLHAPLAEHRLRTNLYLRLIAESKQKWTKKINTDEATILYIVKGYGKKCDLVNLWGIKDIPFSPFKEYVIKRDDSLTDEIVRRAKQVYRYRKGKGTMPGLICNSAMCSRAKKCSVATICFSGKYKQGRRYDD